jgi:hypothetical protein
MTIQDAQVAHFLPGRIRLKSAQVKGNVAFAQKVQQALASLPGVLQVEVQPATGSVLILYNAASDVPLQALAGPLRWSDVGADRTRLEDWLRRTAHEASPGLAGSMRNLFSSVNVGGTSLTSGRVELRTLVPLLLVLLGCRSLLITRPLPVPPWYDFFWFALGTFMALNPPAKVQISDAATG